MPLGPSWELLGPSWSQFGGLFGDLGAVLGACWAVLGRRKAEEDENPKTVQSLGKLKTFLLLRAFQEALFGRSGASREPLGSLLGPVGKLWGLLWQF